jgi:hypothetical protein
MAIAFVGAAQSVRTTGGTSLAVTMPTGFASGDLLLLFMEFGDNVTGISGLTGWTQFSWSPLTDGTAGHFDVYYKISDGTESPTVTWTTNTKPNFACVAYSGVDGTTPIVASGGALDSTSSLTIVSPSVTNTGTGVEWAVAALVQRSTSSADKAAPITQNAALTERADYNNSGAGSSPWCFVEVADSAAAVTAAAHQYDGTFGGATASAHKYGAILYLNPASGGGSPQTLSVGHIASGAAVRGVDLSPGPVTLSVGHTTGPRAVRGVDITGSGAASLGIGKIASRATVRGVDISGSGAVSLGIGKVASNGAVRGVSLTPGAITLALGKIASNKAVRGVALTGSGSAPLSIGKIASSVVVRGIDLATASQILSLGKITRGTAAAARARTYFTSKFGFYT